MKKTLLSFILSVAAICMMAEPVSLETTLRLANFFFHEHGGTSSLALVDAPQYPHMHIYSAADGHGFVIISADDVVMPILAYSATSPISITNMPDNVEYWLGEYENQIRWNIEHNHTPSAEVTEEWQHLNALTPNQLKPFAQNAAQSGTANLLSTTWGQGGNRYNAQCPYDTDEGERTLTGCVATAMAQIMKYWGYPLRGIGSYSYNDPPYGTQAANFSDTVFNYADMPNKLTSSSSQTQIDAVALLMRRCGIAVEMEYGVDGSAATTTGRGETGYKSAENAYRENFKYMHTLHSVSLANYTDNAWVALMQNEINNGRPVHYSAGDEYEGGGHSFICCGYDNTGKLYFNWGWSGSNDGYYTIGQLNPGSDHYNARNKAIIGIVPDTTESATTTITLAADIPGAATLYGAGTYNSYTDEATIMAIANPGYLVDGWNDNLSYNPYTFLANGGNVSYTAHCTKMTGDTLGYGNDNYQTAYGSSSNKTHKWGIRFDSTSIAPTRRLEKISAFFTENGKYTVEVCSGTATEPTKVLASMNFNVTGISEDSYGSYLTGTLSNPIPVDREQSFWITFSWTGQGYPKSCSDFRGNLDGIWNYYSNTQTWQPYTNSDVYYSWFIRGIFGYNPGPYKITVTPDDTKHGTTTGTGTYAAGTEVTITATPKTGYIFKEWNDGVTASSRTITVTDVANYTAYFDVDPKADVICGEVENIAAYSNGNELIIENAAGETMNIYDAAGRLVMTRTIASSRESIVLPAGTYFAHINMQTYPIVVTQ